MYERFTDRARKVMQLANQEAQRFNHEYIGTEHVLLGLIKESSGVASNVLRNLDIDLRKVRLEVEKIVQAGPNMVSMGKLPHTPRSKKVIEYSMEEAHALNHNYVGTEHLLLGLLREQEGVAAQVLTNLGLNLNEVREEILNLLGFGDTSRKVSCEIPKSTTPEIEKLHNEKEEAICNQDFQLAGEYRDRIKKLERKEDDRRKVILREIISHVLEHFNNAVDLKTTLSSISDTLKEYEGK